jgi:hypothetical protein
MIVYKLFYKESTVNSRKGAEYRADRGGPRHFRR